MLFKPTFIVAALATLAVATPTRRNDPPASQCNTGDLMCCQSTQTASTVSSSSPLGLLLGLLGVIVGDLTGQVGVTCSPITVVGGGSASCTAQPVCCTGNSFNGVIATGCSPININL